MGRRVSIVRERSNVLFDFSYPRSGADVRESLRRSFIDKNFIFEHPKRPRIPLAKLDALLVLRIESPVRDKLFARLGVAFNAEHLVEVPLVMPVDPGLDHH